MAQRSYRPVFTHNVQYVGSAQDPYEINWARAIAAGLVATDALMIFLYMFPSWLRIEPVDVAGMTGALLLPRGGSTAFWVGLVVQMVLSAGLVSVYAAVLLAMRRESTWYTGVALGASLWCLGPITALPLLLRRNPVVEGGGVGNPGVLLLGLGATPVFFLLLAHLAYGAVAGTLYKHIRAE